VRQRKTGRPVRFELTEQTRQAVDDYLKATGKVPGEFLFTSRRRVGEAMTTRQYARLVAEWIAGIGLDPSSTNAMKNIMEVDPNGNIFRYPGSIKGDRHLRDWRLINLIVIERYYKEIFEVAKTWHHKLESLLDR
jgi:integrase